LYYDSERHVALAEERITMPIAPRVFHLRVFGLILLILTFVQWPVASQTTGRIAGTVKEQSGAVIVGAEVLVASESSGDERKVITDQAGDYSVPLLSPGVYRVTIRARGFAEVIYANVNVTITETTFVNVDLALGVIAGGSVTVSAAMPLVQASGPQLGRAVDSRAVSEPPLATRNFTQILGLSTGAADSTFLGRNTQTISGNGARVTQNSFQLNGIDATTMGTAGSILVAVPAPENCTGIQSTNIPL